MLGQTWAYRYFLWGGIRGEELCVKVLSFPLHTGAPLTWGLHLGPKTHYGHVMYTRVTQTWLHTVASKMLLPRLQWLPMIPQVDQECVAKLKNSCTHIYYHNCKLKVDSTFLNIKTKTSYVSLTFVCMFFCICVRAYVEWKVPLVLSSSEEAARWHTPSAPAWWTLPSAAPKGYSGKDTKPPVSHKDTSKHKRS